MRSVKVTFDNGHVIKTSINGTEDAIRRYYLGQEFNFGDTDDHPKDLMLTAVSVEFIDNERTPTNAVQK